MYSTIITARNYVRRYRHHRQDGTYAGIEMPNGMKCNPAFWMECVHLGILTWDD